MIHSDKPLLILDLSIPRNVDLDVKELPNVTLVHLDDLSKMTDRTLRKRKTHIPKAEEIIGEVKQEFDEWLTTRKFAPTIKALKHKLTVFKNIEIDLQRKKMTDFNEQQADIITDRIIQKITNQFEHHLRHKNASADESIEFIEKVFQLQNK